MPESVYRMRFFKEKVYFLGKMEISVKNMLTEKTKGAILSELLETNCF